VYKILFFSTALECTLWKLPMVSCEIPSDKNFAPAASVRSGRPAPPLFAPTAADDEAVKLRSDLADLKKTSETSESQITINKYTN
jgi:hypothetical protein